MLGQECKIYYLPAANTRATWGTQNAATKRHEATTAPADLAELGIAKDVDINSERQTAPHSSRGADFVFHEVGALNAPVTLSVDYKPTNADYKAIFAAYLAKATLGFAVLDGAKDVVGVVGLWADYRIAKWPEPQKHSDHIVVELELLPYDSGVDPEYVEITAA